MGLYSSAKGSLPLGLRRWLRSSRERLRLWHRVGSVDFGDLRRLKPIGPAFGSYRGLCIDRYYIERFLLDRAPDIQGHVLEIGDDTYTRRFGGNRVTKSDVLHAAEGNPKATIIADLSSSAQIPSATFDCVIFTQTLHFIYDFRGAIRTLHRVLKPRGVLLATFAGITQISRYDMERWGDYWRFTTASARRLFEEIFGAAGVTVRTYGNVLSAISFLHGLAAEELNRDELDFQDPDYEVSITVRAVKSQ